METWSDRELIDVYEAMFQSQMDSTFTTKEEAGRFLAICAILGERGYTLADDERTWVRQQRHE